MSTPLIRLLIAGMFVSAAACAPPAEDPSPATGTGGRSSSSGGSPGTASGGSSAPAGTGGTPGTGGQSTSSGGAQGTGGAQAGTGGRPGTGGAVGAGTGGRFAGGTGGVSATGGASSSGGATGTGGRAGGTGGASSGTGGVASGTGGAPTGTGGAGTAGMGGGNLPRFSFFVTSLEAMRALSGSQNGFGGDLRFGQPTGLAGADKICTETAKRGMPGAEAKTWRAFLSATTGGPNGGAINAIDRVGEGPWYDRMGRLVAMNKAALAATRPMGANAAIISDLPNENGIPNQQGVDNHDTLTGSNNRGMLLSTNMGSTCNDWTSSVGTTGKPMLGHSWPANSGQSWIQAHSAGGCGAGVNLVQMGGANGVTTVGAGGGYGGIYCFALTP